MTLYNRKKTGRVGGTASYDDNERKRVQRIDLGNPVETNYATETNSIIYIMDSQTYNFVAFKTFLKSFKLNIKPTVDLDQSLYILDPYVSRGQSTFTYSISLDVPASSPKEAESNLAKMQDLFRFVGTVGNRTLPQSGLGTKGFDRVENFTVYFANLINQGTSRSAVDFPFGSTAPHKEIEDNGINCIIKKVEYNPSIDTGFFESGDPTNTKYLPKHYTLDLDLLMLDSHDKLGPYWPFSVGIR